MRTLVLAIAVLLAPPAWAMADDPPASWKGAKVMPKMGAVVTVGNNRIDYSQGGFSLPWIVQDTEGNLLLVGDRRKGWVEQSQVVALEDAPAYYSQFTGRYRLQIWAYDMRALAWKLNGDLHSAIADYGVELRLNPTARTYNSRGLVSETKKDHGKAIADFEQAIRIDPKFSSAYNNAAWFKATCPDARFRDGKRAIELATRACDLTAWKEFNSVDTLAGAYAEVGDFDSAIKYQSQAIEMSPGNADFLKKANERLELYKEQKPYREE